MRNIFISIAAMAAFGVFLAGLIYFAGPKEECPREPNAFDLELAPNLKDGCGLSVIRPYPYPERLPDGVPVSNSLAEGRPL